jgi:parallel beta-helix repeat protein
MHGRLLSGVVMLMLGGCAHADAAGTAAAAASDTRADTVHVAAPTGERDADRASILAALTQVRPGGTIQFASGTYLIGEIIPVPVSRITLVGHASGSTLRGCGPEEWASVQNSRASCNTLELLGSHQTVRDLTFEHMSLGLALGPGTRRLAGLATGDEEALTNSITGGHLIEGNTFRDSSNGIRGDGRWSEPIVIRGNRFINTYHAVSFAGSHVHLLDNDIAVPQPERVPITGHPGLAVGIAGANEHFPGGPFDCDHNVIAGNRIEGHPQGSLYFYALGGHCRHNVIRDNTIIVPATTRFSGDPSEEAGVPLLLYVAPMGHRSVPNAEDRGSIEQNVIEGNHIVGAEGLGIAIYGGSRNRIVANTIAGITRQERNLLELEGIPGEQWREANGSAIWVSPGSDENEIAGNIFEDIASHAIVLEGERNRVELRNASDRVRDVGNGNRVGVRGGSGTGSTARAAEEVLHLATPGNGRGNERLVLAGAPEVVHVAAPTGERAADRASILAALARIRPGGTVQFAPGMYLVGALIRVDVPRITLLGHADGTTLRGCDPAEYLEQAVVLFTCAGFELSAGHQTVRNLTFEYTSHGLFVGCCWFDSPDDAESGDGRQPRLAQPGGHVIEGNTFRFASNPIRVIGASAEPILIRGNRFVNNYHVFSVMGGAVHFLDNDVTVPEPGLVPIAGHPGGAVGIMPFGLMLPPLNRSADEDTSCSHNVIAGNRIEGHPDAIDIGAYAGSSCRHNTIRDNTLIVRPTSRGADTPIVGVPLAIRSTEGGLIENNHIEGNRIAGAEGLGIEVFRAARNRISNNLITGISRRDPFPGSAYWRDASAWREGNGSGIWLSPGSDENEIIGNVFSDVASAAVVLEGDRNVVELRSEGDAVRDLGNGNRVTAPMPGSSFVETRGIRLHYLDFGGSGLPLIFVHDWYEDTHTWT